MKLRPLAAVAAAAITSLLALTAGTAAPAMASGSGMYMFTGNEVTSPVPLSGSPSATPPKIITTPIEQQNGTIVNYGTIEIGTGNTPPGDGGVNGIPYEGWYWSSSPAFVQLDWAQITGWNGDQDIVVQNVAGHFDSTEYRSVTGGYATTCLSFQVPGQYYPYWVQLNAADQWIPVTGC
jgi:hypothetical protein